MESEEKRLKKALRKVTAFILALVMCLNMINLHAYAENANSTQSSWDGVTRTNKYEGEKFCVTFTLTDYWNGGYNANVKVENTGNNVIENWYLGFMLDNQLATIWNAEIVSNANGMYVVKNVDWNADIPIGGYVEFGISVDENFTEFPTTYVILGEQLQVKEGTYKVEYILDSDRLYRYGQ